MSKSGWALTKIPPEMALWLIPPLSSSTSIPTSSSSSIPTSSSSSSSSTSSSSWSTWSSYRCLSTLIFVAFLLGCLVTVTSASSNRNRAGRSKYQRHVTLGGRKVRPPSPSAPSVQRVSRTHVLAGTTRSTFDSNSRSHSRTSNNDHNNNNPYRPRNTSPRPSRSRSRSSTRNSYYPRASTSSSTQRSSYHRTSMPSNQRSSSYYPRTSVPSRRRQSRSGVYRASGSGSRNGNSARNGGGGGTRAAYPSRSGYPRSGSSRGSHRGASSRHPSTHRRKPVRSSRPNIVVIMTDDQDVLLGSLKVMPKLANLMTRQGMFFNNSFVSTPMCCPSRSTFLTGVYVHNHNVYTNNDNCSSPQFQRQFESRSFATYINTTHITGYFGKYLNEYNGSHTPPGWSRWVGLIKNSRFYNYSVVDERGQVTRHRDNYYKDYLTDLVANDSCSFLLESKKRHPDKPVMMMLSLPAPHGPEDAAPQYQHMFDNNTDHRNPAWNHAPNPDKQWLLEHMYKMIPQHKIFTDLLQRRRLQTLQSVDDVVEKVVDQLDMLGELDNTYIIYTSDHGYHLGQYGILKGKGLPYDYDVRVPLIVRGPGITPGSAISNIVHNIDLAPTIIDLAGGSIPDHMDGQSFLKLIKAARDRKNIDPKGFVTTKKPWRDTVLLERGKLTERVMRKRMQREEQVLLDRVTDKAMVYYIRPLKRRLVFECSKESNRLPCKPQQKWYCIEHNGRLRKHKCRNNRLSAAGKAALQRDQPLVTQPCECPSTTSRKLGKEKRKKRRFRKRHARADRARYHRKKRSVQDGMMNFGKETMSNNAASEGGVDVSGFGGFESMFNRRCRILSNQSVICDLDIYQKTVEWESHKERIDDMIKEYRKALEDLRDIRRHLRRQKPLDSLNEQVGNEMDPTGERGIKSDAKKLCQCDQTGRVISEPRRRRRPKVDRGGKKKLRKRRRRKRTNKTCNNANMSCFTHNNEHWKTPPYWHYGPFCFCSNANNNTFWCLRTVNQTHDFLYCEFITTFMSFYDLRTDPFQLKNIVTELNYGILQQLHEELKKLKHCSGARDCMLRSGQKNRLPHEPQWPGLINLKRSKPGHNIYKDFDYSEEEKGNKGREDGRRRYTSRHHKDRESTKDAPDYE